MRHKKENPETVKIITDILLRLNRIETRLYALEAVQLAGEENWLNDLIDYVNSRNFSISPNEVAKEEFENALKEAN